MVKTPLPEGVRFAQAKRPDLLAGVGPLSCL